jgi:hypothetical protein
MGTNHTFVKMFSNSAIFLFMLAFLASPGLAQVIFQEGFETGGGSWNVSNGVWEVGMPTSGPNGCHSGSICAATVLAGNYPSSTSSRLESAPVQLPTVAGGEEIHLRFWHWFSYANAGGQPQVSVFDGTSWNTSAWVNLGTAAGGTSAVWTLRNLDLTAYAGARVKIGFLQSNGSVQTAPGWYIDDIEVVKDVPVFSGNFESGLSYWSASNGIWEVGAPTSGPGGCHSGSFCAATVLAGNYPSSTSSRLESAPVQLPTVAGGEEIHLRFWHWYSYANAGGQPQVSVFDGTSWNTSAWVNLGTAAGGTSALWTARDLDLTAYTGALVKIGFLQSNGSVQTAPGWYIDDIIITGVRPVSAIQNDFDGDKAADLGIFRPGTGYWHLIGSKNAQMQKQWGLSGDIPVPGDYEGDGIMDIAVWRLSTGTWYSLQSNAPSKYSATQWGLPADKPLPADYDGDGKTDIAVWRPSNSIWYILASNLYGFYTTMQWGLSTDIPVPADYDDDGKADITVFRPDSGIWYALPSGSPGTYLATQWGTLEDKPVPGDYDGDGKADFAVWRPSTGIWYALSSKIAGSYNAVQWGLSDDLPVPVDYDGDGKTDIAVWRSSSRTWYILPSSEPGAYIQVNLGESTDIPLPLPLWMRSTQ